MIRATIIPLVATSAFIGYTQAAQPWLIQPVSIFSVYGLNLLIMLVNFALARGAMLWFDRNVAVAGVVPVDAGATRRWLALTALHAIAWIGVSLAILNGTPLDAPTVRVAALQPGCTKPAFQDEVNTSQVRFAAFVENARAAARQGAQILYTPEMMFNFDPQVEFTDEFRALAREIDAYIFITYVVAKEGELWRNESVLLSPTGEFSAVYGKNKIPPVALAAVGIVLLAGAGGGAGAKAEDSQPEPVQDPEKAALNKRMETIAWGCFLFLLGGFMFVPNAMVNRGLWSIGLGAYLILKPWFEERQLFGEAEQA